MRLTPAILYTLAALAAVLLAIGAFAVLAGAASRAERRRQREIVRALHLRFERFLTGRGAASAMRRDAARASSAAFWSAIETLGLEWRGPAWPALARELERNRHCAAERHALSDDSPLRRELAARRLGLLRSPASRRALRRALVRGPDAVAFAAALSLARHRDRAALRWVLDHSEVFARRTPRARVALLRSFGRAAKPDLLVALEAGRAPELEHALIETLGIGGLQAAVPAIANRLTHPAVEVRVAAARSLGRLEARATSGALSQALADQAWQVRAQAAWALGRIGATEAIAPLVAALPDRAWWVRHHAAYALAALGAEGRAALLGVTQQSSDPYARDIAEEALAGGFHDQGSRA